MNLKVIAIAAVAGAIDAKTVKLSEQVSRAAGGGGSVEGALQGVAIVAIGSVLVNRFLFKQSWTTSILTTGAFVAGGYVATRRQS